MIKDILLFLLAVIPVIILGIYIYSKDTEKEPTKVLFKLFMGGVFATFLTIIITIILENNFELFKEPIKFTGFKLFVYSFITVGLVEEFCKWIFVYLFSYNEKEYNQFYDMIVYSSFSALGFAFVENILYVYLGGISVAILRIFLSIPAHVSMAIFMGYYLSFAKLSDVNNKRLKKIKYILLSLFIPSIFHGIYDYCLLSENVLLLFIFFLFVIILFYEAHKKISNFVKLDSENKKVI